MSLVHKLIGVAVLFSVSAACQPIDVVTPFVPTAVPTLVQVVQAHTVVPTAHLLPSRTPTIPVTPSNTPTPTATPTETFTPSLTPSLTMFPTNTRPPTATLTLTPLTLITAEIEAGSEEELSGTPPPTLTPPPPDPALQVADHLYFRRPVSDSAVNWVDRNYPYGATSGGRLQVHHGVEFQNPRGTLLYAVADGTVYYAGDDLTTMFGPFNNYYGNLVVIQHTVTSADGRPIYTLYGHMDRVSVQPGQPISAGQEIGFVGGTGVALGPHLHFEVRVGNPQDFGATRNPELWIRPYPRYGTLAGRVTDSAGNSLYDVTLKVESADITRYAWSYADATVNGDDVFGENFTLGDIPADYYTITVGENGRVRFQQLVYVYPNRTTFINVQLN